MTEVNQSPARLLGLSPRRQQQEPTVDEAMAQIEASLDLAIQQRFGAKPVVVTYMALRDGLRAAGLSKEITFKILPKIKVSVSDNFINHAKFQDVIVKFTAIIARLYKTIEELFGEDAETMMLAIVEDRFALIMPM